MALENSLKQEDASGVFREIDPWYWVHSSCKSGLSLRNRQAKQVKRAMSCTNKPCGGGSGKDIGYNPGDSRMGNWCSHAYISSGNEHAALPQHAGLTGCRWAFTFGYPSASVTAGPGRRIWNFAA
jgi:hypothetical protein